MQTSDCHFSARATRRTKNSESGSVLIVALLLAALIALAVGTLLSLNLTSSRLARRSLNSYAALNLGEAGLEEGTWSLNRAMQGDSSAWNDWTQEDGAAWHKFPDFDFGRNTNGWVKVYISRFAPAAGAQPKVVALASVNPPGQPAVTKMLEATLRRRSYFSNALVAKESVVFNGLNTSFDSWNSDPDGNPATPAVDYSAATRLDTSSVSSVSTTTTAVMVRQAQIWGYVATGGSAPTVNPLGTIRGGSTPGGVLVDPARVSTDFNAEFATITAPTDGTPIASVGATLGTFGAVTRWRVPGVSLTGTQTLTIQGDVTLIITAAPGTPGLVVGGRAMIIIPNGSKLTVYLEGDMRIAGQGVANGNVQPSSLTIWGTNQSTTGQDLQIAGNGALRGLIYAPNGDVKINGNGDVMGSIVARNITLVGDAAFHYDESLANDGSTAPFGIGKWRELSTQADRSVYLPRFNGW